MDQENRREFAPSELVPDIRLKVHHPYRPPLINQRSIGKRPEGRGWYVLHHHYEMRRVNHQIGFSLMGCTNQAESFFSRMRRAEIGTHHHISGPYLGRYAVEMAWREDHRRKPNGEQFECVANLAMVSRKSAAFARYWQRTA